MHSGMLAGRLGRLRSQIMQWTDRRVGYMSEILNGIQVRNAGQARLGGH